MKVHITKGNIKLGKMLNFSLPPIKSCPGSTPTCRKICYAKKSYIQYPAVRTAWDENFIASKQDDFIKQVNTEIRRSRTIRVVRIHVSGDMYNQAYLDKWIQIAKDNPEFTFYTYTKTVWLDFSKRPSNLTILLSDDNEKFKDKWHLFDGVSKVGTDEKGWFTCPGSCITCNHCFKGSGLKVVFHKH